FIPSGVKRLLTLGRSTTVDGNTLDPTLQLMLAGQRAVGIDGLVVGDPVAGADVAASRTQLRETMSGFAGPEIHVEVTEISLPGPAGEIAARHYRPAGGAPAP